MLEDVLKKISKNCNREELIALICEAGLVNDRRIHYGKYDNFRASGHGEGIYQMPDQMADFLLFLKNFRIRKWVEVGTFNGWHSAFVDTYLRLWNLDLESHTIDIALKPRLFKSKDITYHYKDSDFLSHEKFDLVYIDGDHSRKAVQKDYDNLGRWAKLCAFHDIDDPLAKESTDLYKEIAKNKFHIEFVSNNIMGIGVIYQSCFL